MNCKHEPTVCTKRFHQSKVNKHILDQLLPILFPHGAHSFVNQTRPLSKPPFLPSLPKPLPKPGCVTTSTQTCTQSATSTQGSQMFTGPFSKIRQICLTKPTRRLKCFRGWSASAGLKHTLAGLMPSSWLHRIWAEYENLMVHNWLGLPPQISNN